MYQDGPIKRPLDLILVFMWLVVLGVAMRKQSKGLQLLGNWFGIFLTLDIGTHVTMALLSEASMDGPFHLSHATKLASYACWLWGIKNEQRQ